MANRYQINAIISRNSGVPTTQVIDSTTLEDAIRLVIGQQYEATRIILVWPNEPIWDSDAKQYNIESRRYSLNEIGAQQVTLHLNKRITIFEQNGDNEPVGLGTIQLYQPQDHEKD